MFRALEENNLTTPTKIQADAFSPIMSGRDVIGIAQTGTGKTIAYLLPLLRLWKFTKSPYPRVLILVPTRELVIQVVEEIEMLSTYMNLVVGGAYGGANIKRQIEMLQNGLDIIVATPGRLYDLLLKGALKANPINKLVIDEVDEMLDLGFRTQLRNILDFLPMKRQTLLFSATMTDDVEKIINDYFIGPIKVEAAPSGSRIENINQSAYALPNFYSKINLLKYLLGQKDKFVKTLIFTRSKKMADLVAEEIEAEFDEEYGVIHSNKSQNLRFNVISRFKEGTYRFIIATDIVSRGIDISGVSHVINFDIPDSAENYIHRIGRTGRAEEKGNAISFVLKSDESVIDEIQKLMDYQIPFVELPEENIVTERLSEDEMPKIHSGNIHIKKKKKEPSGPAFHEKKPKNMKTNPRYNKEQRMKSKANKIKKYKRKK